MRFVSDAPPTRVTAPTSCPFCRSLALKTTNKIINESTYWRCTSCGEIWNPGRLRPQSHFNRAGQR